MGHPRPSFGYDTHASSQSFTLVSGYLLKNTWLEEEVTAVDNDGYFSDSSWDSNESFDFSYPHFFPQDSDDSDYLEEVIEQEEEEEDFFTGSSRGYEADDDTFEPDCFDIPGTDDQECEEGLNMRRGEEVHDAIRRLEDTYHTRICSRE